MAFVKMRSQERNSYGNYQQRVQEFTGYSKVPYGET